jgi:hypothetical protein
VIIDCGGDDEIRFGSGIVPADISFSFYSESLLLIVRGPSVLPPGLPHYKESGVAIEPWKANARYRIERIRFADGAVLDAAAIAERVRGATGQ